MSREFKQALSMCGSYIAAAERCFEERTLPNGKLQILMLPGIVCYAFAAEIGIKAIGLAEGRAVLGHPLTKIFGELSPGAKAKVIAKVGLTEERFAAELLAASKTFVEWRYLYEKIDQSQSGNIAFLRSLASAARETAEAQAPP